jgi:dCMP deaminase
MSHTMHMQKRVRPGFPDIYLQLAQNLSARSTCCRLQVGTVITSTDFRKVLAVGYNGNATGLPNQCDRDEAGNCGCLHSEENAVINCDSPRHVEKIVFVTHLPCMQCAKRLINLGNVKAVYYIHEYRIRTSVELLRSAGIEVCQKTPEIISSISDQAHDAPQPAPPQASSCG